MLISFDLDDTLICREKTVPAEPNRVPWPLRFLFNESLRLGTVALYRELKLQGWQVCIYTTSFRPAWRIRGWLWWYGIRVNHIINQDKHQNTVGRKLNPAPSKHPPSFGIQLHVDDSELIQREGQRYKFETVIIKPADRNWVDQVLQAATRLKKRQVR